MNYHILWLKIENNKNKNKIFFYKKNYVLEVGIGKNGLGILGDKSNPIGGLLFANLRFQFDF
jgi:hypothetical protein